jgi:hypothetical protein
MWKRSDKTFIFFRKREHFFPAKHAISETENVNNRENDLDYSECITSCHSRNNELLYTLMSRIQNVGLNHNIRMAKGSFENVAQYKYLGTTVTNQNLINEVITSILHSGNACYHSVQNLSCLLSKNVKIMSYKTIILPVVCYGCEIWSLILREEHTEGVLEQGAENTVTEED